ncbi:hypothetical protein AGDE_16450 [Angomonas deanei]|uniref:Uncharacterized protein n=1 Tax=Angomonas deanei TaxID=59799 RepID=A0A7G2C507_9TRYP|nr:hypothetical protein AGDE_16450 [Angomonas deanei]CAD2213837.1 hypothetical protein, conserved [Angomonas deanei]|eukprot:EPY17057.1 hypothetical protein AGDE_16450 [Angomonas deanei]
MMDAARRWMTSLYSYAYGAPQGNSPTPSYPSGSHRSSRVGSGAPYAPYHGSRTPTTVSGRSAPPPSSIALQGPTYPASTVTGEGGVQVIVKSSGKKKKGPA